MRVRWMDFLPLFLGDAVAVFVISVVGFAFHGSALARVWSTFLPMLIGWALIAPWLGLYQPQIFSRMPQIWRAGLAALLAAPIAGVLRGWWLNSAVLPVFVGVLGATAALGMILWRALWAWHTGKRG